MDEEDKTEGITAVCFAFLGGGIFGIFLYLFIQAIL